MSVLTDEDFLLQSLRLSFLRNVSDPLATLITFDDVQGLPRSGHVVAAGLDDAELWPELRRAVADEDTTDLRDLSPGAGGLQYSETIGGASGAGMRVGGRKRTWAGRRDRQRTVVPSDKGKGRQIDLPSETPTAPEPRKREALVRIVQENYMEDSPFDDSAPNSDTDEPHASSAVRTLPKQSPPDSSSDLLATQTSTDADEDDGVQTTPDAAQSYIRQTRPIPQSFLQDRELSDALRWGNEAPTAQELKVDSAPESSEASGTSLRPQTQTTDNEMLSMLDSPSLQGRSSTSDDAAIAEDSSTANEGDVEEDGSVLQKPVADAAPGVANLRRERRRVNISGRAGLTSTQMPPISEDGSSRPPSSPSRGRAKSEARPKGPLEALVLSSRSRSGSLDTNKAATVLEESRRALNRKLSAPNLPALDTSDGRLRAKAMPSPASPIPRPVTPKEPPATVLYPKATVQAARPQASALTARMKASASSASTQNPYHHLYGALRTTDGLEITVFFPESKEPLKSLSFTLRRDCTVEETIGLGLREYYEQAREPRLDADLRDWDGESLVGMLDPARWNLMLAEADGEIDYDFPLSRDQKIRTVGSEAYGIIRADEEQYNTNVEYQSGIVRRPSRTIAKAPRDHVQVPSSGTDELSAAPSSIVSTSQAGDAGPQVLLRVRIPMLDSGPVTSTIKVPTQMYLADVLERICHRRQEAHLSNSKDWVLLAADRDFVIPLDRTVESLQGNHQLRLARKKDVKGLIEASERSGGQLSNTNPNAPIFKRLSEPVQPRYVTAADVTSSYREWTVYRKSNLSLTRHERILSIDGDYVNIRSAESGRMGSFHISSIVEAKQSKRMPSSLKLTVWLDNREMKRQDYETATSRDAAEIVARIKQLAAARRAAQPK